MTWETWLSGMKNWREQTSTSPLTKRDLSKYKSFYKFPEPKDDPDAPTDHERLFGVIADIAALAVELEHPLERWTRVVNAMLEKIADFPMIEKLRVIHLFEADMNFVLGELWRRLMRHAETQQKLGQQQWGSRAGRNAIDAVMMKLLSYTIAQLTRTPLGSFDEDAKSCYDRIIVALGNLRAQQLGMPEKACKFHAALLKGLEYNLKTSMGVSDETYKSTEEHPLYGYGQGSRNAAAAWAILSVLLIDAMDDRVDGATFTDPAREIEYRRIMDGFVDDMATFVNKFLSSLTGDANWQDVGNDMSAAAQWWEQLLFASGGKLELPKCFFYLINMPNSQLSAVH